MTLVPAAVPFRPCRRAGALALVCALGLAAGCGRTTGAGALDGGATSGPAWFEDVASARGLQFRYQSGHQGRYLLPEIMGGGGALFDMDGDGDLDVYLVQGGSVTTPDQKGTGNRLFRNDGAGTFVDVTDASHAAAPGYGMGVTTGDYDNDGDVDLYVTNIGPNVLLQNDGRGVFTDVTGKAGVGGLGWSTSAAFFDADADGDLDLFVLKYINWSPKSELECFSLTGVPDYCSPRNYDAPMADVLYRNNGDGTFSDVSGEAGLHAAFGNGLGIVVADFSGDGRPDVFVANDAMPNQLWLNQGGRFRDVALIAGVAVDQDGAPKSGMGVDAVDVDHDGDRDLLVVNLDGEADSFYRNDKALFTDDTVQVGLRGPSRRFTRFGTALIDFDNDGQLDLYEANGRVGQQAELFSDDPFAEPNLLFKGTASGRFEEVSPRGGTARSAAHTSRAAIFGDIDNDGGIDILVVNRDAPPYLLHNVVAKRGHWALIRVVDEHGRDAYGAQVATTVGSARVLRDVKAAYSYLASNDPRVHIGLGAQTSLPDVTVRWVDGTEERFGDLPADRVTTLKKGGGRPVSP
ncbi:MAG: CRTAC1 family protein [Vicinamibacterales bacterium]